MKKSILIFALATLVGTFTVSCSKKSSPEPEQVASTSSNSTPTTTPTYSTATYNMAMLDVVLNNQTAHTFGTNQKFMIVADNVAVDSMTVVPPTQQRIVNDVVDVTDYCNTSTGITLTTKTFKIQTNAAHQFLNYYENNVLMTKFLIDSSGKIFSIASISGTGIFPYYPGTCSYLCIVKA